MKVIFALLLSLAIGAPVYAADLGGKSVPTYEEANTLYFAGASVGIHGGFSSTNFDISGEELSGGDIETLFDGIAADGVIMGGQAEYLFAFANRFRIGVYAEGGLSSETIELLDQDVLSKTCYYGGGLKAGWLPTQTSIVFARAGYERQCWEIDFGPSATTDATADFWVFGVGAGTMVSESWSLGVSADYLVFNDAEIDGVPSGANDLINDVIGDTEAYRGLVRLNYHLN